MNTDFAQLADIVVRLMRTHPDAPQISSISLADSHPDGWSVHAQISRYKDPVAEVTALADWADLLGTCVRLIDRDRFVEVAAVTRVDGRRVRVWGHLVPRLGLELAAAVGASLTRGPVEVVPALIIDALGRGGLSASVAA